MYFVPLECSGMHLVYQWVEKFVYFVPEYSLESISISQPWLEKMLYFVPLYGSNGPKSLP